MPGAMLRLFAGANELRLNCSELRLMLENWQIMHKAPQIYA